MKDYIEYLQPIIDDFKDCSTDKLTNLDVEYLMKIIRAKIEFNEELINKEEYEKIINSSFNTTKTQHEYQQEILEKTGLNIVTCGNCGAILIHEVKQEEITCPYCNLTSDICDFPDLIY